MSVRRKRSKPWQGGKRLSNRKIQVVEKVVQKEIPNLPHRVHRAATRLNLHLIDVAERMGISGSRLSDLLHADTMTMEAYRRLCVALEVDEEYLAKRPKAGITPFDAARRRRSRKIRALKKTVDESEQGR